MKKFITAFVAVVLAMNFASAAQKIPKYKNKQLALFSYVLSYDQAMKGELNKHLALFEANAKVDPIENALRNRIYYLIKERLEKEIGLIFLPIESFQNAVDYDDFGFPSDNINKVIRVGNSKLYFKLEVSITSGLEGGNASRQAKKDNRKDSNSELGDPKNFKPTVSIALTVYNNKGIIPKDKFRGIGNATEDFPTDATLLDGLVNNEPFDEKNNLLGLANEAVTDLIINLLQ